MLACESAYSHLPPVIKQKIESKAHHLSSFLVLKVYALLHKNRFIKAF